MRAGLRLINWVAGLLGGGGLDEAQLPMAMRNFDRHPMNAMMMMGGGVDATAIRHLIRVKDQAPFLILIGDGQTTARGGNGRLPYGIPRSLAAPTGVGKARVVG